MVQSRQDSTEPVAVGSLVADLVAAFGGVSEEHRSPAAKRRNGFSSDQLYLIDKANARASKPLSFGGLTKLNQTFGEYEVTEALRDASIAEDLDAVYPYVAAICSGQGRLA